MPTTLGDLVAELYDSYLEDTGDPEVASVATAAIVNDLLCVAARRVAVARARTRRIERELYALA